jgi:hypothetical protein
MFCNGFKCFSGVFASVSDAYFKCYIVLRRMLQLLHLDVSKLDRLLHLPTRLLLPRLGLRCAKRGQAEVVPLSQAVPTCMRGRVAACSKWACSSCRRGLAGIAGVDGHEAWVGKHSGASAAG